MKATLTCEFSLQSQSRTQYLASKCPCDEIRPIDYCSLATLFADSVCSAMFLIVQSLGKQNMDHLSLASAPHLGIPINLKIAIYRPSAELGDLPDLPLVYGYGYGFP